MTSPLARPRCLPLAAFAFALVGGLSLAGAAQDEDAESDRFAESDLSLTTIEHAIGHDDTVAFTPVGTTSVVFRMRLAGDIDAAFKPQTRTHPRGDLAEVAAYRIARALGMRNVVPAVPRVIDLAVLERQLDEEAKPRVEELRDQMVLSDGGTKVRGAAIYWVPDLRELGIDTDRGIRQWSRWLGQVGAPPYRDKSKLLARQISNMIVLDYLIGNWDRFSGANAQGDREGRNLLVRDHNVAFYVPLPKAQHRRLMQRLRRVQRFSRTTVERLEALDGQALSNALVRSDDPPGYTALDPKQQAEVLERRRALLSYIAALIAQYGEDRVLLFP